MSGDGNEFERSEKEKREQRIRDMIHDLNEKKRREGSLSDLEESLLQTSINVLDFEEELVQDKIKREIQKSLDAGETYFRKPEETKQKEEAEEDGL